MRYRLELVTGKPFQIVCKECGGPFLAGDVTTGMPTAIYANLNGAPFADYYCALCAGGIRAKQQIRAAHLFDMMRDHNAPQEELPI